MVAIVVKEKNIENWNMPFIHEMATNFGFVNDWMESIIIMYCKKLFSLYFVKCARSFASSKSRCFNVCFLFSMVSFDLWSWKYIRMTLILHKKFCREVCIEAKLQKDTTPDIFIVKIRFVSLSLNEICCSILKLNGNNQNASSITKNSAIWWYSSFKIF